MGSASSRVRPARGVADKLAMLVEDVGEVALAAGHVAQAQDGAPAGGTAIGLDVAAGGRLEQRVEGPAVGEQDIEPALQFLGGRGLEPLPNREQLLGLAGETGDARQRVRHDADGLALLPEHQHLRLGLDDRLGGQQALAQLGDLGVAVAGCGTGARGAVERKGGQRGSTHRQG